jgi:hypothetical protein
MRRPGAAVMGRAEGAVELTTRQPPGLWLQLGSLLLPILKCALCPMCLGIIGSAVAGARFAFLADERLHGGLLLGALVADAAILARSRRHHGQWGPLVVCAVGAVLAAAGHFLLTTEALELAGFAVLMVSSIWNARLLWVHRRSHPSCCAHGSTTPAPARAARGTS